MCLYTMIFPGRKPNRRQEFYSFKQQIGLVLESCFPYFLTLSFVRDFRKRGFDPEGDFFFMFLSIYECLGYSWLNFGCDTNLLSVRITCFIKTSAILMLTV